MSTEHNGVRLRVEASAAIDAKVTLLKRWLVEGIPWQTTPDGMLARDRKERQILEYFPDDIRAFSSWTSASNSPHLALTFPTISTLRRISRSTLLQPHNSDRLTVVKEILTALKAKAKSQLSDTNLAEQVSSLDRQCKALKNLVRVQEHDIFLLREQVKTARQAAAEAAEEREITLKNAALEIKRIKQQKTHPNNKKATVTRIKPFKQ